MDIPSRPADGGSYRRQLEAVCTNATVALFIMDASAAWVITCPSVYRGSVGRRILAEGQGLHGGCPGLFRFLKNC